MRLLIVAVGRPGRLFAGPIAEYERRARRYWDLEVVEVREERAGRGRNEEQLRAAEAERMLERIPAGLDLVALTRVGEAWSSTRLANYIEGLAVGSRPGAVFLIGGAFGLSSGLLARADRRLSLSPLTLPHEFARLLLVEQIYRAGTIVRREPYHKARD